MNVIRNPFAPILSKGMHSDKSRSWLDLAINPGRSRRSAAQQRGVRQHDHCGGFTLLEVLVALFILAVAMTAVSHTANSSIHHVDAMRTRIIGDWVAQNRMAQHQARGDWPAPGIQSGEEIQAGQTYTWEEEVITTPNPTLRRIIVRVHAPADANHTLRELTGYLVQYPR
ncbi:MAG: type II secretion system minor pseudopilin GspI [Sideroxyarcus sp.]|nr:type II secretion system minor pseudopilin GspI [Sideroxyarcus sp.]